MVLHRLLVEPVAERRTLVHDKEAQWQGKLVRGEAIAAVERSSQLCGLDSHLHATDARVHDCLSPHVQHMTLCGFGAMHNNGNWSGLGFSFLESLVNR